MRVRDTGVGIPAQELPRLFDRFHRIENTRSRTHEGSGIGLALVQELVKLHGGSVRVESALGEGSTFIVSLPLGECPSARRQNWRDAHVWHPPLSARRPLLKKLSAGFPIPAPRMTSEEALPSDELIPVPCPPLSSVTARSEKRPVILLADDNADMRQYLVRLLAERYEVQAVADGQAALAVVQDAPSGLGSAPT